jgi:hypothetical protein
MDRKKRWRNGNETRWLVVRGVMRRWKGSRRVRSGRGPSCENGYLDLISDGRESPKNVRQEKTPLTRLKLTNRVGVETSPGCGK